ncbi:hypothetical protein [Streptomyces cavernae]|nr:hypothetical protein [Streptomyces cavernae]
MAQTTRTEHDLVGDEEVPADACYGAHTERAVERISRSPHACCGRFRSS